MRRRVSALYAGLIAANLLAWGWALAAFYAHPVLLGTALLAYGLGLRHAVDADHIAAIDNVTRKLMQDGQRPVAVGFFFALGHSAIVLVVATAIAASATTLQDGHPGLFEFGSTIGTAVSAAFLLAIAGVNAVLLVAIYRLFATAKRGGADRSGELEAVLGRRGVISRVLRRVFRLISRSWHMFPLGMLFGLGFDTASEIGLLGIAAAEAVQGLPIASILIFPILFTAGMSLVDTTDGVLMLGAYGFALRNPFRTLYYNLAVTGLSVVVALLIGGIEALGLIAEKLDLTGGPWDIINTASGNLGVFGYVIIALFAASWLLAMLVYRLMGYDRIGSA